MSLASPAVPQTTMTVQQLIDRVVMAAQTMGEHNPNRLLMLNLGNVICQLTERVDKAERELAALKAEREAEHDTRRLILLPGGKA